jgi:oligosaccharyltransferase complex subunit beta
MILSLGAIFFSFVGLLCAVQAKSSTGNSVLVVLQPSLKRDNFTIFFNNLESKLECFCYESD